MFNIQRGMLVSYTAEQGETEVVVPEGVHKICDFAFHNCSNVESIVLPDSLEEICICSFMGCPNIQSITFPERVRNIEKSAFEGTLWYSKKAEEAFIIIGDGQLLEYTGTDKEVRIPETVKYIGNYAFKENKSVEIIHIPETVISIGDSAFEGCVNLKEIGIPDSIERIGKNAFKDTLWFIKTVNVAEEDFVIVGNGILLKYKGVSTEVELPANVKWVCANAFDTLSGVQKIVFPEGIKVIGTDAFNSCFCLTEVIFPKSLRRIEMRAFAGCRHLKTISFSQGLEYIGLDAFYSCEDLAELKLPYFVKVDAFAFAECTSLREVTLPKEMTLTHYVFHNCKWLKRVEIPYGVKMGNMNFQGCINLKDMVIYVDKDTKMSIDNTEFCEGTMTAEKSIQMLRNKEYFGFWGANKGVRHRLACDYYMQTQDEETREYIVKNIDSVMYALIQKDKVNVVKALLMDIEGIKHRQILQYKYMAKEIGANACRKYLEVAPLP